MGELNKERNLLLHHERSHRSCETPSIQDISRFVYLLPKSCVTCTQACWLNAAVNTFGGAMKRRKVSQVDGYIFGCV